MKNPILVFLILLFVSVNLWAQSWQELGSGKHSLQDLGKDFYVNVPVKRIEGARLVLFNYRAARQLGLQLPDDPQQLEKMILENFAFTVSDEKSADKTWMATYYQDSGGKGPGEARGDGRALWSGEMLLKQGNVNKYIDFVLKGVGQTPLAWLNHSDPGHKDGWQSMREAVHAFIMSEVNYRNELDTTVDLAVIEIPVEKKDKHTGKVENSAITLRVGEQTRTAHFRYWSDNAKKFEKIFDYAVKRGLGFSPKMNFKNESEAHQYREMFLQHFATRLADEAARYYDLHAVHSSPTPGNRTSSGATIDLGTFRYLDSHHANYSYLFDQLQLGGQYGQTYQLKRYISDVVEYAQEADVYLDQDKADAIFDREFEKRLTAHWLHRIGLDATDAAKMSKASKERFYEIMMELHEATNKKEYKLGDREFKAAAYEPREIFRNFWNLFNDKVARDQAIWDLLASDREWFAGVSKSQYKNRYFKSVHELAGIFEKEFPDLSHRLDKFKVQAQQININVRPKLGPAFVKTHEAPIVENIQAGKLSVYDLTQQALKAVPLLVDPGLIVNTVTNLGTKERVGIYTGTFDPPHEGHRSLLERLVKTYGLSKLYVIVNPESDHKSNVTALDLRIQLAHAQFAGIPNLVVADVEMTEAFRKSDVEGVLKVVEKRHPHSEIYHTMGDDSFERFLKVHAKIRPHLQILVNPRSPDYKLPTRIAGLSQVQLMSEGYSSSSTEVRQLVAAGKKTRDLKPETLKLIQQMNLYKKTSAPSAAPSCRQVFAQAGGF